MALSKVEQGVVGRDLLGYPYNIKYPPNMAKYGGENLGYATWNQQVFFYEFAVQGTDVSFWYNGKQYFIRVYEDCAFRTDETKKPLLETFPTTNALLEQMDVDGHKLISLIDTVDNVELC